MGVDMKMNEFHDLIIGNGSLSRQLMKESAIRSFRKKSITCIFD
jgi:hypothetical protein